jgi:hypothetical protein
MARDSLLAFLNRKRRSKWRTEVCAVHYDSKVNVRKSLSSVWQGPSGFVHENLRGRTSVIPGENT